MATKQNAAEQIQPGTVTRALLNTATAGSAVIAKVITGSNITLGSTGADAGTGDVTIGVNTTPEFTSLKVDTTTVMGGASGGITLSIGTQTTGAGLAQPAAISFDNTISATPAVGFKIGLYGNNANYGIGLSAGQVDYVSLGNHAFWATSATKTATITTSAITALQTTASTSTTTGALVSAGGLGVAGTAYVGGNVQITGAVNATAGLGVGLNNVANVQVYLGGTANGAASVYGILSGTGLTLQPSAAAGNMFAMTLNATLDTTNGVPTAAYGMYLGVMPTTGGNAIPKVYGLYVNPQTAGTANYNYVGGLTGFGTALPTHTVDVSGTLNVTGLSSLSTTTTGNLTVTSHLGVGVASNLTVGLNLGGTVSGAAGAAYGLLTQTAGLTLAPASGGNAYVATLTATIDTTASVIPNGIALYLPQMAVTGANSITNAYGLYVQAQTVGTNNYHYIAGLTGFGNLTPTHTVDIAGTLNATGLVTFTNATDASSPTAGAVALTGGLAVAKSVNIGGNLDLGTGTATVAPITFGTGVNKTTPAVGDHEFDGTNLYITNGSGRQTLATAASVAAAIAAIPAGPTIGQVFAASSLRI